MENALKDKIEIPAGTIPKNSLEHNACASAEALLNHLSDVIIVFDKDINIKWASDSVENEWGYKSSLLDKVVLGDIFNPQFLQIVTRAFLEDSARTKIGLPFETSVRSNNGSILWTETRCSYIENYDGDQPIIVCCFRDTSLRKLLDDTMQENLSLLQILIDSIPDAIFITDKGGIIEGVNRAFEDVVGMHSNSIRGRGLNDLSTLSASEFLSWLGTITNGVEGNIKIPLNQVTFADGGMRDIVFNKIPYTTADGDFSGAIGIIYDITERKRLEDSLRNETQELKKARTALSEKNAELEAAYLELKETQAQILQQEKMASIGQLAAGVAHEINNPMGFISSNLSSLSKYIDKITSFMAMQEELIKNNLDSKINEELLSKKKSQKIDFIEEDIKDLIRESLDGTERVKKIVQDLKTFSRNDQLEYMQTDINECIESTINIVWNELKYKVKLYKEYGDIPLARCFPQQINQVFMNLLVNAAHAIETSGELKIRTWSENGWIYATVTDSGHGIPPEIAKRIFEPFFTTKEAGKGTGLGLSITYDIIKKHGGDITVDSMPGEGTTFTIRIPVEGVMFDE